MDGIGVEGLYLGKGQRLADLRLQNPTLSDEEIQSRLDIALDKKLIEKCSAQMDPMYFKKP